MNKEIQKKLNNYVTKSVGHLIDIDGVYGAQCRIV